MSEAVDRVEGWYRNRGLRAGFQLFDDSAPALRAELVRRRYQSAPGALVLTAERGSVVGALGPASPQGRTVEITDEPSDDFRLLVESLDRLTEISATTLPQRFVVLRSDGGEVLGGSCSCRDGKALGLFAMYTVPRVRRAGVALDVLRAQLADVAVASTEVIWLQTMVENQPARSMSERLGFTIAHHYEYRWQQLD